MSVIQQRKSKVIQNIKSNYKQIERSLVEQLYIKHDIHGGTIGSMREDTWKELFQMVLPQKFVMEQSVFIIDSKDGISREVDLAIIDKMYTPYIFRYGRVKFIPIEAVAVVVECKSTDIKEEIINAWCDQISNLRTAKGSIVRLATYIGTKAVNTQQSTRPLRILCKLDKHVSGEIEKKFDFVIYAQKKGEDQAYLEIKRNPELSDLWMWFKELDFYDENQSDIPDIAGKDELERRKLDDYVVKDSDGKVNKLLTFNLQLNQLLMLINNPMLFPHLEYVEMFNRLEEADNENDCSNID